MMPLVEITDVSERRREKAAARTADERAIASADKTIEQVHRENAAFAFLPERARIELSKIRSRRR